MEVRDHTGSLIGHIEEEWTMWTRKFRVRDAQGTVKLYIVGSFTEGGESEFKVIYLKKFIKGVEAKPTWWYFLE
jgi:hypothetical protein